VIGSNVGLYTVKTVKDSDVVTSKCGAWSRRKRWNHV